MTQASENSPDVSEEKAKSEEYEVKCQDKLLTKEMQPNSIVGNSTEGKAEGGCEVGDVEKEVEEGKSVSYQRKVTVLYELLAACVKEKPEYDNVSDRQRKSYDARHRVALRLLATWLNVEWTEVEAMEVMVACSLMGLLKEDNSGDGEFSESSGNKWKRGGIICAAALTGGALMAITGGLAAPAIAQGLGALALAFGSIIPAIGASAGAAGALGSAAGSIAVAASFGAAGAGLTGTKMARQIGGIEEFEFKEIGENHNQATGGWHPNLLICF